MPKAIFHYGDHLCPIQSLKTFGFLKQFSNTAHHLNIFHSTGKISNYGWSHPVRLATVLYDEMAPRQQCSQQCPRELQLDVIRYSIRIHIWLLCKWLSLSCDYFITLVLLDYCNTHKYHQRRSGFEQSDWFIFLGIFAQLWGRAGTTTEARYNYSNACHLVEDSFIIIEAIKISEPVVWVYNEQPPHTRLQMSINLLSKTLYWHRGSFSSPDWHLSSKWKLSHHF